MVVQKTKNVNEVLKENDIDVTDLSKQAATAFIAAMIALKS